MSEPDQPPPGPAKPDEFDVVFDDEDETPEVAPKSPPPGPASPPAAPAPPPPAKSVTSPASSAPPENPPPSAGANTGNAADDETLDTPSPPARPRRFSRIEIASLAGIALLMLVLFAVLGGSLLSHIPISGEEKASRKAKVPVTGTLLGIAGLDAYWRPPVPGDRIKSGQALIPEVKIRLRARDGAPATAYLRLIIRDDNAKIRGDVTAEEVSAGNFAASAPNEIAIHGTEGFPQEIQLTSYAMEGRNTWTIEILEGASYTGKDWKRLVYFNLPSKRLP